MNTSVVFKVDPSSEEYIRDQQQNSNFFQDGYAFSLLEDLHRDFSDKHLPVGKFSIGKGCPAAFNTKFKEGSVVTIITKLEYPHSEKYTFGMIMSWFSPTLIRQLFHFSPSSELTTRYLGQICQTIENKLSKDAKYSDQKWISHMDACSMKSVYKSIYKKSPVKGAT